MTTPSLQLASRSLFLSTGLLLLFGVAVLALDALPDPVFNRQGAGQMVARRSRPAEADPSNILVNKVGPAGNSQPKSPKTHQTPEPERGPSANSLAAVPRTVWGPQLRFEEALDDDEGELATPFDQPQLANQPRAGSPTAPRFAARGEAPNQYSDRDFIRDSSPDDRRSDASRDSPRRTTGGPLRTPLPNQQSPRVVERPVPRWEVLDLPAENLKPADEVLTNRSAQSSAPRTSVSKNDAAPGAPRRRVVFVELDPPETDSSSSKRTNVTGPSRRQDNSGKVLARTARLNSDPARHNDALPWSADSGDSKSGRRNMPERQDPSPDEVGSTSTSSERNPRISDVELRLGQLQTRLDQMAQAQTQRQSLDLDRALQTLQQIQNSNRIQEMERQLQEFQRSRPGVAPPVGGTAGSPTGIPPTPPAGPPVVGTPGSNSLDSDASKSGVNSNSSAPPPENPGTATGDGGAKGSNVGKSTGDRKPILTARPTNGSKERFSLQIQDADITQVLEMLGQMSDLNILVTKEVRGIVSLNLQDVTVDQALQAILRSRGFVFERDEKFLYVSTAIEQEARKKLSRKLITKVYRPHYISVKDLQALVTPILTPLIGKVAVTMPNEGGLQNDSTNAGGDRMSQTDALLVQDYDEVQREVEKVLKEMDIPPMQVVIEAMILSVKLNDEMQFGVNFALLSGGNRNLAVSGNGNTLNGSSGFPGVKDNTILPPAAQFLADTAGLKYGFIRGDISGFINALETITDTNLIASPQLRVINKQRAQLIIGDRLSYSTSVFQNNQAIQNVNFVDAGTKLIIRPYISADGMVRMEIHPERSTATINRTTNLPDIQTTEVTTNVMVRDGTTVVIGGLIEEQAVQTVNRVPLLGSLPVVGAAFRSKTDDVRRTELIVLITPRIVRDPDAELEGNIARDEGERRAEHFRENMSHVNRKSLTRIHFERALSLYENGDLERAQAHIQEALRQNKNDIAALRLRDQIAKAISERNRNWVRFPGSPTKRATQPRSNYSNAPIAQPAAATPGAIPLPTEPGPETYLIEPQPVGPHSPAPQPLGENPVGPQPGGQQPAWNGSQQERMAAPNRAAAPSGVAGEMRPDPNATSTPGPRLYPTPQSRTDFPQQQRPQFQPQLEPELQLDSQPQQPASPRSSTQDLRKPTPLPPARPQSQSSPFLRPATGTVRQASGSTTFAAPPSKSSNSPTPLDSLPRISW